MKFIEFVAVLKRQKMLVISGVVIAFFLAVFSAYSWDGSKLVSRSKPVYETTAVVAITPGSEINLPAPSTTVPAPRSAASDAPAPTTTAVTTTTVARPPDDVIDSRGLYYAALSIKTAVVAPGFTEQVHAQVEGPTGSITAVTALDTNTIRLVVTAPTPEAAAATMDAALSELQSMVDAYATNPSVRYTLDSMVISPPSTPEAVSSIKGPLTFVLVFIVALVLAWLVIRADDILNLHRREQRQLKRAQDQRAAQLLSELESTDEQLESEAERVPSP